MKCQDLFRPAIPFLRLHGHLYNIEFPLNKVQLKLIPYTTLGLQSVRSFSR